MPREPPPPSRRFELATAQELAAALSLQALVGVYAWLIWSDPGNVIFWPLPVLAILSYGHVREALLARTLDAAEERRANLAALALFMPALGLLLALLLLRRSRS